jgi:soluble P-type ATPase
MLKKHIIKELRNVEVIVAVHSEFNEGLFLLFLDITIFLLKREEIIKPTSFLVISKDLFIVSLYPLLFLIDLPNLLIKPILKAF